MEGCRPWMKDSDGAFLCSSKSRSQLHSQLFIVPCASAKAIGDHVIERACRRQALCGWINSYNSKAGSLLRCSNQVRPV